MLASMLRSRSAQALLAGLALALQILVFASIVHAAPLPAIPTQGTSFEPVRSSKESLVALQQRLSQLSGEGLQEQVRLALASDPETMIDLLVLRAGSPVPTGLPVARSQGRQAQKQEALDLLAGELKAGAVRRALITDRLLDLVSGVGSGVNLRCAALRVCGVLELHDSTWLLELGLADDHERVRHAATQALSELYGRWHQSADEWRVFLAAAPPALGPSILRELRAASLERRALTEALLAHEPQRAVALLADAEPDPLLRRSAAQRLTSAVTAADLKLDEAWSVLAASLERELDGETFSALLDVALLLSSAAEDDQASPLTLIELFEIVRDLRREHLYPAILSALPQQPLSAGELDLGSHLLAGILRQTPLLDQDLAERALQDWRALAERATEGVPDTQASFLMPLLAPLLDDASTEPGLATAAAAGAPLLLRSAALGEFVAMLRSRGAPPALLVELCVAVRPAIAAADAGGAQALASLRVLQDLAAHPEVLVRRAALQALLAPECRPLIQRFERDPATVLDRGLERLAVETDTEALVDLLLLVGQIASPEHLARLTGGPAYLRLRDPALVVSADLTSALAALAGSDAGAMLQAAHWLVAGQDLPAALRLVTALPQDSVAQLSVAQHGEVMAMSYSLRRSRGPQALDEAARERLLQVHSLGAGESWQSSLAGLHLNGLLLGDSATAMEDPAEEIAVVAERALSALNEARALAESSAQSNPEQEALVSEIMRDRFLLLDRLGRPAAAAQLMASLCEQPGAMHRALSSEDLRRGAVLLRAHLTGEDAARGPRLASTLMGLVIHADAWALTTAPRRLEDLENWVADVLAAGGAELLAEPRSLVGEVPELLAPEAYIADLPLALSSHALAALMETREDHERLMVLARHLALGSAIEPEPDGGTVDGGSGSSGATDPPEDGGPPPEDGGGR